MIATKSKTNQPVIEKSKIDYYIVHKIPGRIRFRVPLLAHDPDYAQSLQELLASDSRIVAVRVNRSCSSVAIKYQLSSAKNGLIPAYLVNLLREAKNRKVAKKSQTI